MTTATPYSEQFFSGQEHGSLSSARKILGELWSIVQPSSVVDVGCGVAPWLRAARDLGASTIVGLDGDYVQRDQLMVDVSDFRPHDLENVDLAETVKGKFDLAMSLEVAEHLSAARARTFVDQLCKLSDMVVFSAAAPGQGGLHHINEQRPDYWCEIFRDNGYLCFDVLRYRVWNEPDVEWWYAQNVLLFAHKDSAHIEHLTTISPPTERPMHLVHPQMHLHNLAYASERADTLEGILKTNDVERDGRMWALEDRLDRMRAQRNEEAAAAELALNEARIDIEKHKAASERLERELQAVRSSVAWKALAPLRAIEKLLIKRIDVKQSS